MYFDTRHICDAQAGSSLDVFDPRSRMLCAFFLSAVLSSVQSFSGLFVGSLIPVSLLFIDALSADGLSGLKRLLKIFEIRLRRAISNLFTQIKRKV